MPIVAVANQKGGVGKTTTAISLGAALAQRGSRVLIVDIDPQGNATSALGLPRDGQRSLYDALLREEPLADLVVPTSLPGLNVVPSSPAMAGAEVELVPTLAREFRLKSALQGVAAYDWVFVDCPPSLGLLTVNALVAAESVLIPVQCEYLALEGLAQLLRTIDAVRARLNPPLRVIAIVLTMDDRRNRLSVQVAEEVRSHFPDLIASVTIPRAVRLAEAPSHGQPIAIYDPGSRAAHAYAELAQELEGRARVQQRPALAEVS